MQAGPQLILAGILESSGKGQMKRDLRIRNPKNGRNIVGICLPVPLCSDDIPTILLWFCIWGPQSIHFIMGDWNSHVSRKVSGHEVYCRGLNSY